MSKRLERFFPSLLINIDVVEKKDTMNHHNIKANNHISGKWRELFIRGQNNE